MEQEETAKEPDTITLDTGDRVYYIQYKPGDTVIFNFKEWLTDKQIENLNTQLPKALGTKVIVIQGCEVASIGVASKTDTTDEEEETDIPLVGGKVYNKEKREIKGN